MPIIRKRYFLGIILLLSCHSLKAQSILIDSLKEILAKKETTVETRIMTTAQLGRITGGSDPKTAIGMEQQALAMSNGLKDKQYKAFVYGCLIHLYALNDSMQLAGKAADSAVWYADKTDNNITKGFVWFRKGWLQMLTDQPDSAVNDLLQALRYLEKQHAYNYESNIYYFLAGIYGDWKNSENELKYARLCLQKGLLSQKPDEICMAYQALGSYFIITYRENNKDSRLLDSVLYYNRLALATGQAQKQRLISPSTLSLIALNTANSYGEFYPDKKDSAIKYINIALALGKETGQQEIVASCYGLLSDYAVQEGNYNDAEVFLNLSLIAIESFPLGSSLTKAKIMQAMAKVAEKKGNNAQALLFYKQYIDYYKTAFDAQQQATAKKFETQYESEKREKELALLQQRAAFNKQLNFFYISLAVAALLALIFFFRAYHFRLRASLQKQQLLTKQHEEANLQSLLNETKAKQLELENHEAQLQLQLQAEATARLEAEQLLLQERQERLQNELLAGALQVEEKNELLQTLQKKITTHNSTDPVLRQMDRIITDSRKMDEEFESTKSDFADIHPEFITRLQEKAGETLTRLDLKYCAYIRMGLSNKEIANRLAVEAKSIRMARYRLKQKLNLQKDDSLDMFLSTVV
ncbi:regulatory protein, luxR family [Chitinophaga sp. CF118]|uniref:helix-turn-helix transcriptional regulator n=1 Tax=Chitinophaga sp. CF118 TaxID=1884367 RepID=UPI0008E4CE7D|nr:LuxR C-terminal-related transcriptional regulator [Chitinophaga sp. CF118]SFD18186.1 regulatory protein, luxR family [Chitinophaga sp. CF118]